MPNIRGIDLSDGVRILSGEITPPTAQYSAAQFPNYLASHSIAQTETTVNNFLENAIKGEQIRIHIFSVSPLKVTCVVANKFNQDGTPYVVPADWWAG